MITIEFVFKIEEFRFIRGPFPIEPDSKHYSDFRKELYYEMTFLKEIIDSSINQCLIDHIAQ